MTVVEKTANVIAAAEAAAPGATRGERFASFEVAHFAVPGGREENWRFTPMRRLRGLHDGSALASAVASVAVSAPDGIQVAQVDRDDDRLGQAGVPSDRIAAQAYSGFRQATVLTIPAETRIATPTTVTITGPGLDQVAYGHLQVRVEAFATAVVVLDHVGSGAYADNVEFIVAEGATLTVVSVQDWADDAVHVSEHHLRLGRDATMKHIVVTLGGELVRLSPTATFAGPGGDVEMLGLSFADSGQHQEHRLFVDHAVPNCASHVMYKSALQSRPGAPESHTVWIGDVLIRAAAEGTQTFEVNRNLLLTENARADSVPNLEIETGEIAGAGHASATGRFDDEQLFYLKSRGISQEQARRLVVRGFFHEILMKIDIPEVRERLYTAIEQELEAINA